MTRRLTGGLIGLGVAAAALVLFATVVRQAPTLAGPARPDDVLLVLLGWAGLLLAAWLALGSLLALAAVLPGAAGRAAAGIAERITPVAVRKALALALGASVGSLALPPALVSVAGSGPVGRSTGPEILAAPDAASRDTASRTARRPTSRPASPRPMRSRASSRRSSAGPERPAHRSSPRFPGFPTVQATCRRHPQPTGRRRTGSAPGALTATVARIRGRRPVPATSRRRPRRSTTPTAPACWRRPHDRRQQPTTS